MCFTIWYLMPNYSSEGNKKMFRGFLCFVFRNRERLKDLSLVLTKAVNVLFSHLERSVLPEDSSRRGLPSQNSAPLRQEGTPAHISCCRRKCSLIYLTISTPRLCSYFSLSLSQNASWLLQRKVKGLRHFLSQKHLLQSASKSLRLPIFSPIFRAFVGTLEVI